MAVGAAGTVIPGPVLLNNPQSATQINNNPTVVLDDAITGSSVVHLRGEGAAPACTRNANSGTGSTSVVDANSTDLAGVINLTTGSGAWAAGAQCALVYAVPHQVSNYPVISAANDLTAQLWPTLQVSAVPNTLVGFTITFHVADSVAAHALAFNYFVGGA